MQKDEIIRGLQAISDINVNGYTEENVKFRVVIKVLEVLGHRDVLVLEHSFGKDIPDIIITGLDRPIIVEVKGANEKLTSHIPQIKRYSYNLDSCLSIITNGNIFHIFSPFWDRKNFEERLVLSFSLKELGDEIIANKVISLLCRDISFTQLVKNRKQMEKEIADIEERIFEYNRKISELKNKQRALTEKYPKILELTGHIEILEQKVKSEIESFLYIKKEISDLEEQISAMKKQIPFIVSYELNKIEQLRPERQPPSQTSPTEKFSQGISDEVINIIALQQGKQIILCKTQQKKNKYIFLLPKTSFQSKFEPSEIGRKLMSSSISSNISKYVADIEYLPITGKSREFWQELYNENEFVLWTIDGGPLRYFNRNAKKKMLLWILRVYEMPFEIKRGEDFTLHMNNATIINPETLKKMQSGFNEGKFSPVLRDDEFEKRVMKIREIARKYS